MVLESIQQIIYNIIKENTYNNMDGKISVQFINLKRLILHKVERNDSKNGRKEEI